MPDICGMWVSPKLPTSEVDGICLAFTHSLHTLASAHAQYEWKQQPFCDFIFPQFLQRNNKKNCSPFFLGVRNKIQKSLDRNNGSSDYFHFLFLHQTPWFLYYWTRNVFMWAPHCTQKLVFASYIM